MFNLSAQKNALCRADNLTDAFRVRMLSVTIRGQVHLDAGRAKAVGVREVGCCLEEPSSAICSTECWA